MSGPKISVYSLSGRARTIVTGQIRCEQQSVTCAFKIQEIIKHLQSFSGTFEREMANIKLLLKRTGEGTGQTEKLQALETKVSEEISTLKQDMLGHKPQISHKYVISEEAYSEKQAELRYLQSILKRAENLQSELNAAFSQNKKNTAKIQSSILNDLGTTEISEIGQTLASYMRDKADNIEQIQKSIIDDISGIYSFDFEEEDKQEENVFENKKKELSSKLNELCAENNLPDELIKEIQQAQSYLSQVTEVHYLHSFESVRLAGIINGIKEYKREIVEKEKAFDELYARYLALCSMAEEMPAEYKCLDEDVKALNEEVNRLESTLIKQQEQEYINDCVNEVMTEMGYDLIGERIVKKRSGKTFRNELFTFNEGTAVNVTYSSDGQIAMELGGISREDRVPSPEECDMLTQDMETFCTEFAEFERRLKAKGIMVDNRIALSPPSAEYAAIINVSDYDVDEGVQITEMQTIDRKNKAAEKKVMRRVE